MQRGRFLRIHLSDEIFRKTRILAITSCSPHPPIVSISAAKAPGAPHSFRKTKYNHGSNAETRKRNPSFAGWYAEFNERFRNDLRSAAGASRCVGHTWALFRVSAGRNVATRNIRIAGAPDIEAPKPPFSMAPRDGVQARGVQADAP